MAHEANTPSTSLCARCSTFQFQDLDLGHFAGREEADGHRGLKLDKKYRQRQFILEQKIRDTLPGLPGLRGCELCDLFRGSISRAGLDYQGPIECELRFIWGDSNESPYRTPSGLIALVMEVSAEEAGTTRSLAFLEFGLCSYKDGDAVSRWLRLRRPERPSPLEECNIRFLKKAINRCESTCHSPRCFVSYVPTRLIDLRLGSTEDPRLVIASKVFAPRTPVKYAALSYCWGSKDDAATQLKTKAATLGSHERGIPIQSMSKVMRDAVETCRILSIGYVWIDALCIIQDDDDDWTRESAVMGSVYQGAFITICALSSSSCHQGFLARETNTLRVPFQSQVDPAISGSYTLVDRGTCKFYGGSLGSPLTEDLQRSLWDQRAWAFQEKGLSRRLILFGHRMLHFHCGIWERSENGFWFRVSPMSPQNLADALRNAKRHRRKEKLLYDVFRNFSQDYAPRELTFAKDRLPAISGLAKPVLEGTGDQYLAGLWEKDLHLGLIWHIPEFPDSSLQACIDRCKAAASQIPSWSWASRRGFFDASVGRFFLSGERHTRPEFTFVRASTVATGANPFGAVSGGQITVHGRVMALPSDLVAEERDVFVHRMWRVRMGASYAAHCQLDWDEAGLDHKPAGKLLLLFLTSSCDERESSTSPGAVTSDYDDDDDDDDIWESKGDGNAGVDGGDDNSCEGLGEGEEGDDEVMSEGDECDENGGEDVYPLYGVASEDGADDCSSCIAGTNRNAWGLVIYPADTPESYYRVGIFTSRAGDDGGTSLFADLAYQEITLI